MSGEVAQFARGFVEATPIGPTEQANGLRFRTARELFAESLAAVPWIAEPFIAAGALTFFEGRPKIGKSTFSGAIARAVLRGEVFLGFETVRSPIVLLSEAGVFGTRLALERAGIGPEDDLRVLTLADRGGLPWPEVCSRAARLARELAAVLFVDTLAPFSGVSDENDAAQALAACAPLMEAAASGIPVVAIRHERKSSGDVGEAGRGSNAYTGAADSIVSIRKRSNAKQASLRELHLVSRLPLPFDTLTVDFDGSGFQLSDPDAPLLEKVRFEVAADPNTSRRDIQQKLHIRSERAGQLLNRARQEVVPGDPEAEPTSGTGASVVVPGSLREIGNREPPKTEVCVVVPEPPGTTGTTNFERNSDDS